MRIISGIYKGKIIKGHNIEGTRPTMDRVKESLFSMIQLKIKNSVCLDLFAGSGNLGIESLSRGIDRVIFVDRETIAINTIKQNVKDLKIEDQVEIYRNDAFKALKAIVKRGLQFDLILLDPPYKGQRINEIIEFIHENELLAIDGIIMAECLKEDELHESIGDIHQVKREIYGITAITIYNRVDEN